MLYDHITVVDDAVVPELMQPGIVGSDTCLSLPGNFPLFPFR